LHSVDGAGRLAVVSAVWRDPGRYRRAYDLEAAKFVAFPKELRSLAWHGRHLQADRTGIHFFNIDRDFYLGHWTTVVHLWNGRDVETFSGDYVSGFPLMTGLTDARIWWAVTEQHRLLCCRIDGSEWWDAPLNRRDIPHCAWAANDLSRIAVGSYGVIHVYDGESGAPLASIKRADATAVWLGGDGDSLAVIAGRGLELFELPPRGSQHVFVKTPLWAHPVKGAAAAAWDPRGQFIAVGSHDGSIELFDRQGGLVQTLEGHTDAVCAVHFTDDGRLISADCDNRVHIRRQAGGRFGTW